MACIIRIHDKKLNGKLVGQLGQSVDPVSAVVWMESSFVSGKDNTATNGNIQIQVTPTAADTVLHNDPT